MTLSLYPIPVWRDNYAYVLVRDSDAILFDSPDAAPILDFLAQRRLHLRAIFNTHHHPDHIGSNKDLIAKTGCRVYGPAHDHERIPGITHHVKTGELKAEGYTFRILDVRAHTRGHICFALDEKIDEVYRWGHGRDEPTVIERLAHRPALFVGDSIFLGGCGRLFEGTAAELAKSMSLYSAEDPSALVCCAHEYTEANLAFAKSISGNAFPAISERLAALATEKEESGSSVPDVLKREFASNPYLMAVDETALRQFAKHLECGDALSDVVGALRAAKDKFVG